MLGSKERGQLEFFVCASLRDLVSDEHILARVDRVLDLGWLRKEAVGAYAVDVGRPCIDPEAALRLMLAGFLLGIVHDRRLLREAQVNLAIRWFAGYELHDRLPDHSSLTRIRQRWGPERFRRIFQRTVKACIAAGLAKGEIVHIDASLIRADVAWESLAGRHVEAVSAADEDASNPAERGAPARLEEDWQVQEGLLDRPRSDHASPAAPSSRAPSSRRSAPEWAAVCAATSAPSPTCRSCCMTPRPWSSSRATLRSRRAAEIWAAVSARGGFPAVPLSDIAAPVIEPAESVITRTDGVRENTVQGFLVPGVLPEEALFQLPAGYEMTLGGDSDARSDTVGNLLASVGLIVTLTIATIALTFNSFRLTAAALVVADAASRSARRDGRVVITADFAAYHKRRRRTAAVHR